MPGRFSYTPTVGAKLQAGNGQTLSATFTPTDADDYVSGGQVTTTIDVHQAPLTITASSATIVQGQSPPSITPTYSGFVPGESPTSLSALPRCGTTAGSASPAGTYPTTCSGAVDPNYDISYINGTLTIELPLNVKDETCPAGLTVTGAVSHDLTVDGVACRVDNLNVGHDVQLKNGGSLIGTIKIGHDLQAANPGSIDLTGGSVAHDASIQGTAGGQDIFSNITVGHDMTIQTSGPRASWQVGHNQIGHDATIEQNQGPIDFENNIVTHNATFAGNTGGVTVLNNTYGNLSCSGDVPAASGQCSG